MNVTISRDDDIKLNGNQTLLNQHYIITGNKRQGNTRHFDKIIPYPVAKAAGGATGDSTVLATETMVSSLVDG